MAEIPQLGKTEGGLLDLDDVLMAPLRGAEGLIRGTVGLVDVLPGVDTGIADAPRFLGDSDTLIGSFMEEASRFLLGFVPLFGSLGTLATTTRAAAIAGKANTFTKGARWLTATHTRRGLLAGAAVDFGGYDGNEERLANFVESFPALRNPLTEFLQSDVDDPEIVGRLKNTVEGLGLGFVTDLLIPQLRGIHEQRRLRAKGFTPEEASKAGEERAMKEIEQLFKELDEEDGVASNIENGMLDLGDGDVIDLTKPLGPLKPGRAKKLAGFLGINVEDFDTALRATKRIEDSGLIEDFPDVNPREMTQDELTATMLEKTDWNATRTSSELGTSTVVRALERLMATKKGRKVTAKYVEAIAAKQIQRLALVTGSDGAVLMRAWHLQSIRMGKNIHAAMIQANASRMLMRKMSGELNDTATKLLSGGLDEATELRLKTDLEAGLGALKDLRMSTGILNRAFGQGLRSLGFSIGENALRDVEELSSLVLRGGSDAERRDILEQIHLAYDRGTESDIAGLQRFLKASPGKRLAIRASHYFINSILSGPRTLVLNVASPLIYKGITMGAESLGGVGQMMVTGGKNTQVLRGLWAETVGIWQGLGDATKMFMKSMRFQNSHFLPDSSAPFAATATRREYGRSPFSPEAFGMDPDSLLGNLVGGIDTAINLPLRFSRAGDELTKNLIGRAYARRRLTQIGLENNITDPAKMEKFVEHGMDKMFWEGQIYTEDQARRRGMAAHQEAYTSVTGELPNSGASFQAGEKALQQDVESGEFDFFSILSEDVQEHTFRHTFTEELPDGSVTKKLQQVLVAHPLLKLFLPFVQTPTNLLREGVDNFAPITMARLATTYLGANTMNFWRKDGRKYLADSSNRLVSGLMSDNPNVRAETAGRLAFSFALTTAAINWALEGRLTGNGPKDPELRQVMVDAGWQPYSLRTDVLPGEKEHFIQFGRLDPLASTLAIIGDFAETLKMTGPEDQDAVTKTFSGIMAAIAGLMSEKSYFLGIKNLVETFTDPDGQSEKTLGMLIGSAVPNAVAQATASADPLLRELEGAVDSLRYRVPTLEPLGVAGRRSLAPQRNILGEQVTRPKSLGEDALGAWVNTAMPVMYRQVNDTAIANELAALQHGFTPPKRTIRGVDLRMFEGAGS